jgi:hypothetical protein
VHNAAILFAVSSLAFAPAPFPKARKPADAGAARKALDGIWVVQGHSVGGVVQGGPGPKWEAVRIHDGSWSQGNTPAETGKLTWTTPYLVTVHEKEPWRVDMAYRAADKPLLYGIFKLDGDRLIVTHASSGPAPTSHAAPLRNGQVRWVLRRSRP